MSGERGRIRENERKKGSGKREREERDTLVVVVPRVR